MARARTLTNLLADVYGRVAMTGTTFVTSAEATEMINQSITELYDLLVGARGPDYYESTKSFTTVAGQSEYPFASMSPALTDFYQLILAECTVGGVTSPMREFNRLEHGGLLWNSVQGGQVVKLYYVPACPRLVSGSDTFDGINGWEEYVVVDVAAKMLEKSDEDAGPLYKRKAELARRIELLAPDRDNSAPERMRSFRDTRHPYGVPGTLRYRIRANTIEVCEHWTDGVP